MHVLRSLIILLFCYLMSPLVYTATAKDAWISLHTRNYQLVGNVKKSELRAIAVQLERFRHIFIKQFENAALNSSPRPGGQTQDSLLILLILNPENPVHPVYSGLFGQRWLRA